MIRQFPPAEIAVEKVHRLESVLRASGAGSRSALLALHLAELDDESGTLSRLVRELMAAEELSREDLLETLVELETALLHVITHARAASKEVARTADSLELVLAGSA